MAKKKVDALKAKQAKQKKMAIGLSVLFVAVLAYQVPKTLKMLKGPAAPEAVAAPAPVTSTTASGTVPPGTPGATTPTTGTPAAGAPVAAGEPQPAVFVDTDLPVVAGEGQLLSFEQFQAKDPFAQQVDPAAVGGTVDSSASETDTGATSDPATDPAAEKPGGSVVPGPETGSGAGTPGGAAAPAPAEPTPPATATTIAINGVLADLAADGTFPAADPVFLLVSTAKDGKSVEIAIAGGVYADGDATITLTIGKPLTLQNTADGSRYELDLRTVKGFVPPKPKK